MQQRLVFLLVPLKEDHFLFEILPELRGNLLVKRPFQWERRVLTKPLRLAKEIKNHPSRFVLSFPFRVLTKPLRVTKELAQTYIKS